MGPRVKFETVKSPSLATFDKYGLGIEETGSFSQGEQGVHAARRCQGKRDDGVAQQPPPSPSLASAG